MTTDVKRSITSDDSSEEDEPITEAAVQSKRDDLNNVWMGVDEEDEEEEDADWSQLAVSSTLSSKPIAPTSQTPTSSIEVDDSKRSPRFKRLWAAVGRDQWNTEAWTSIMSDLQTFPIEEARVYYEAFLTIYPTAGLYWKLYAEHEYRQQQYEKTETILSRALDCPCLELWLFYLHYTKQRQLDPSQDAETIQKARQNLCQIYEKAIECIGGLIDAGSLWLSYLQFLQEDTHPQSFLIVRKVFHRVLSIPLLQMDMLWREYEVFEKGIPNNEALAAGFFKVYRQKFDAARAILKDRQSLWQGAARPIMAVPVTSQTITSYRQAMQKWQSILMYEMKNPERLPTLQWRRRMHTIFEVVLSSFYYSPELWYQYASFEEEAKDLESVVKIYQRGMKAIPSSSYLVFALADHYELRGELKQAKGLYETHLNGPYGSALVYITYQRFARRALGNKGIQESRTIFKRARKDTRQGACTYHVYAAAALLEFYSDPSENGREIALNIFELGLKSFIHEPDYILSYIDFLLHLHDDKNMRSFFEKVLAVMPIEKTRPIWDRYVAFEHSMVKNGGDLSTVAKVEARRALAFPDGSLIELKGLLSLYHRYSFLDVVSSSTQDQLCIETYRQAIENISNDSQDVSGEFDDRFIPGPPMPEFLKEFASLLPLQQAWNGPIADVEHIYRAMLLVDFPPRSQIEYMEHQQILEQERIPRRTDEEPSKEIMGVTVSNKRPPNDVFRARQKQKLAKLV